MRFALIIFASLTTLVVFLLAMTSRNTTSFSEYYWPLLLVNIGLVAIIVGLIVYQLYQLIYRLKHQVFGSRLTLHLVVLFAALGIIPVALVYIVSAQFMTKSIESWFDVRVEKALESGIDLGQKALDHLQKEQNRRLRQIARHLSELSFNEQKFYLVQMREQLDADSMALINPDKDMIFAIAKPPDTDKEVTLSQELMVSLKAEEGIISSVEPNHAGVVKIYSVAPLIAPMNGRSAYIQMVSTIPDSLVTPTENVQDVYRDYQEISAGRENLKRIYLLTLTMVSMSTLFGSVAFAFLFSNRLAAPLSVLAEGTRAVAEGDFRPREDIGGADELSLLTRSFNQMTRQLDDAKLLADQRRLDMETSKAYLESILLNLSTGVLAFDSFFCIKTINRGAQEILQDTLQDLLDTPLPYWLRHTEFALSIYEHFKGDNQEHWREQKVIEDDGIQYSLLIRGSRLPEESGGGYVVVFDEISQLIQAQKLSAWSEVAQRLAHEIKNPLTPIQLSAERLSFKLAPKLSEADAQFLDRSVGIIVDQVAAMKTMVNSFKLYGKLPFPKLTELDMNAFIRNMLQLYDDSSVEIQVDLDESLPKVLADADQIRQIIHNLVQNAEDAQQDQAEPRFVRIITKRSDMALLMIEDNGPGFPEAIMKKAFEPYVTTKAKGTGLGLPIVKKMIDDHQGSITLDNLSPRGGKITIGLTYA